MQYTRIPDAPKIFSDSKMKKYERQASLWLIECTQHPKNEGLEA